jgi:hypothetical protein
VDNIVWKPRDLIERAFKVPKYSYILLDEWEDSTYWSELGITLRQFFRKCRQLNLFIMCIIPNWFQLPLSYAVSRSTFAIDVRFNDKLERGYFAFYNFPSKRMLYVLGKRAHYYGAAKPTFLGRFPDGYGVDEKEYRKRKYEDMIKYEEDNPIKKTKTQIETELKVEILNNILKNNPEFSSTQIAKFFNASPNTIRRWKRGDVGGKSPPQFNYNNNLNINEKEKEIYVDEEALMKNETGTTTSDKS